jgi:hypothetical protein
MFWMTNYARTFAIHSGLSFAPSFHARFYGVFCRHASIRREADIGVQSAPRGKPSRFEELVLAKWRTSGSARIPRHCRATHTTPALIGCDDIDIFNRSIERNLL